MASTNQATKKANSAVKHSIRKPILCSFVSLSTTLCSSNKASFLTSSRHFEITFSIDFISLKDVFTIKNDS